MSILIKAIYKITNQVNQKSYIGQSINPEKRFSAHKSAARNHRFDSSQALYYAINKYGEENFIMEVLEWTENYNEREIALIREYNTLVPNGYNIAKGGEEPPHYYGEEHPGNKISEKDVDRVIYELKFGNLTEPEIGRLFNPPYKQVLINNINWGITHHRDSENYPIRTQCPYHLTEKQLDEIIWLLSNSKCPMSEIAKYYNINKSAVVSINVGRNHYNPDIKYPIRTFKGNKHSQPVETILVNRSTTVIDTQLEMGICNK